MECTYTIVMVLLLLNLKYLITLLVKQLTMVFMTPTLSIEITLIILLT